MPEETDNTGFIANQLTNTHSGYNWLSDYFHYVQKKIADGEWDDATARQQFKDAVMRAQPLTLFGTKIREDTIDWERLYNECWERTKPKYDGEKRDLRERLERRGIDPDEFGWLTLTGEEHEWVFSSLKNRSTAQPNEEEMTSEQEPETRVPRKMYEYRPAGKFPGDMNLLELSVEGISAGLRSMLLNL